MLLLVAGRRREGDEDRWRAEGRELGDGAGAAAGDDDVGEGEDVGKLRADEVRDQVAGPDLGRELGRVLARVLDGGCTALVDDVGLGVSNQGRTERITVLIWTEPWAPPVM